MFPLIQVVIFWYFCIINIYRFLAAETHINAPVMLHNYNSTNCMHLVAMATCMHAVDAARKKNPPLIC